MTEEPTAESFDAVYRRAQLLFNQHRYADAAEWFQKALQHDPHHGMAMALLALSWIQTESTQGKAVDAARRGIGLESESSFHHAVLAACLLDSAKPGQDALCVEAGRHSEKAIELDPDSDFAWAVNGQALLRLRKYPDAEKAARRALELDTGNTMAAQVLSMALLNQKKDGDLNSLVDWQLAENPEDDRAHVSAGYRDLMQGRHTEACGHFRAALRLDPTNEGARHGLVESFRARSWFYRVYLRFGYFMTQFGQKGAGGIMIGGYLLYRFAFSALRTDYPAAAYTLAGLWMVFALWTFLARGIGSALMLTDRFVRMAITPKERWEGLCVGGMVVLALGSLAVGLWFHRIDYVLSALACGLASVPVASAFKDGSCTTPRL
jgi:tetratricopeptide (TPR) repeat protein